MVEVILGSLESFLAVVRHGSLRSAAETLFIAQSTLTHRIQQLESDLGTELFTRHSGGVILTAAGERFVPTATAIVEQMQTFAREVRQAPPLRIVAGKAFTYYELPRLISGYRKVRKEFRCYVRSLLFPELSQALLSGTADVAFIGHEMAHPGILNMDLGSDRVLLITHPQHPWGRRFPGFEHWVDQELIAFGDVEAPFRVRVDEFLARQGVKPDITMELDSISAVKKMVMEDLGVAFLPERTVREDVRNQCLIAQDVAEGQLTRPTLLAIQRTRQDEPMLREFIEWVRGHY